ncbi:hypothetical protein CC79DRAFT_1107150 [Sarocladium strictum]
MRKQKSCDLVSVPIEYSLVYQLSDHSYLALKLHVLTATKANTCRNTFEQTYVLSRYCIHLGKTTVSCVLRCFHWRYQSPASAVKRNSVGSILLPTSVASQIRLASSVHAWCAGVALMIVAVAIVIDRGLSAANLRVSVLRTLRAFYLTPCHKGQLASMEHIAQLSKDDLQSVGKGHSRLI